MKISTRIDDREAQRILRDLEQIAKDMTRGWMAVAERMEQRVRTPFRIMEDPWGNPWPEHAESTKATRQRAGNYSGQILVDTGKLFASITRSWDANSATVEAGDGIAYASVHQYGERAGRGAGFTMPQRAFMPLESPDQADLPDEWWEDIVQPINQMIEEIANG